MLTPETYTAQRTALEGQLAATRAAYEAEALAAVEDPRRAGARARLRGDVRDLEEQLRDLDAAWRAAAQRQAEAESHDVARERAEAAATALTALTEAERLADALEATLAQLVTLSTGIQAQEDAARRAVLRHAGDPRTRDLLSVYVMLLGRPGMEAMLSDLLDAALHRGGRRQHDVSHAVRVAADVARRMIAAHFPVPADALPSTAGFLPDSAAPTPDSQEAAA